MKSLLIASTSTIHGGTYLDYLSAELEVHFKSTDDILFIPYARPGGCSHDEYTETAQTAFKKINKNIHGIHEFKDAENAVKNAKGIFVGGGNTFVLLAQLYKNKLLDAIKEVIENGTPYLGTSAGSNICGLTINTTNDMPIIYPPSFKSLGLVPFNINPHYLDPIPDSKHMGETREMRISEFHIYNTQPVIGIREGSWIAVKDNKTTLRGNLQARIFEHGKKPYEVLTNTDLGFLK